jgi:K+-transporting ATPase ATPase C chain
VGSELIGQPFQAPKYFWGRPSATTPMPYNAGSSGGSNREPTFWNSIWPWMGGRGNIT